MIVAMSPRRKADALSERGLELLRAQLGSDPTLAATEFERLRRTLTRFFEWRGVAWPDEQVDEVVDRVVRKLAEGLALQDLFAFALGIARLVLLEAARRRPPPVGLGAAGTLAAPRAPVEDDDPAAARKRGLEECLGELPSAARELLLAYYTARGREKIERRQRLAAELALSESALRNRVQRLRDRLEACVRERERQDSGREDTLR